MHQMCRGNQIMNKETKAPKDEIRWNPKRGFSKRREAFGLKYDTNSLKKNIHIKKKKKTEKSRSKRKTKNMWLTFTKNVFIFYRQY